MLSGDSFSVDPVAEEKGRNELQAITKNFHPDDIFNADETVLYFRLMPSRSLVQKNEKAHGIKKDKERITVLVMTNATGTYKNKLLIIGKFSKPQCLKNIELKNLPATYRSGPNAWMNFCIFQEFLISFNNEMIMKNKESCLFLIIFLHM